MTTTIALDQVLLHDFLWYADKSLKPRPLKWWYAFDQLFLFKTVSFPPDIPLFVDRSFVLKRQMQFKLWELDSAFSVLF